MLENVTNLLYRHPEFYELMYPEPDFSTPRFCRAMFNAHLGRDPKSILDLGCGTGRDLAKLAEWCQADCLGVDGLQPMIDYARRARPELRWEVADVRTLRLNRTFDAILSVGGVILYALTDDDLDATFRTFAAHAHVGTSLVLDLPNAAGFLAGGQAKTEREFSVNSPAFSAKGTAHYEINRHRQQFTRRRKWIFSDGNTEEDLCTFRMIFPGELTYRLRLAGFQVTHLFDNKDQRETDLAGITLYVVARFVGKA